MKPKLQMNLKKIITSKTHSDTSYSWHRDGSTYISDVHLCKFLILVKIISSQFKLYEELLKSRSFEPAKIDFIGFI